MGGSKSLAQRLQESHLQIFHFAVEGLSANPTCLSLEVFKQEPRC